jgi:hypothetical protein
MALAQPTLLVCGLLLISVFGPLSPLWAAVLLGLAVAIKPQLAIGIFLFVLWKREYRKLIVAGVVGFFFAAIGYLFLAPGSIPKLIANLWHVSSGMGCDSGSPLNPGRWRLLNLDALLPRGLHVWPVIVGMYAIIVVFTAVAVIRTSDWRVALALFASATLLILYHGVYDTELLWFCIPLLLSLPRMIAVPLWGLGFQFLVPSQAIAVQVFSARESSPWSLLLLHHETLWIVFMWMIVVWIAIGRAPHRRNSKWGFY